MKGALGYPSEIPVAEAATSFGALLLLVVVVTGALSRSWRRRHLASGQARFLVPTIVVVLIVGGGALAGWGLASIGARHVGDWVEIRDYARKENQRILAESGNDRSRLSENQYRSIANRLEIEGRAFTLGGAPSAVRPHLFYDYPYLGFDFGDGLVVRFEPHTMWSLGGD
ncbi:MAG: hypothetical protein DCC48_18400 [Acidobacteria bacterium]|nr:MAG: hypothetical protein DCC48_18400 [Acidobacteriota bacterium]